MTEIKTEPLQKPPEEVTPPKSNKKKVVTLTTLNGRRWSGEFEGNFTHKDIKKLQQVIRVEFAKITRRRSLMKTIKRQQAEKLTKGN